MGKSKFGERKYHRGHRVVGTKLIGEIDRTENKCFFAVPIIDYSAETIYSVIKKNIESGSILYTDLKTSFDQALDLINSENDSRFTYKKLNHSEGLVALDGTHINNLKGTWNGIKCNLKSRQKTKEKCPIHIMTFIWRRQNKGNLWNAFIEALKSVSNEDD